MGRFLRAALAIAAVGAFSCQSIVNARADERVLGVALIAPESTPALEARWAPLLSALSASIGVPIEVRFFPDYSGAVWSMRDDRSQIAWFGNKSAIEAVDFAEGEVFARKVDVDGEGGYYSFLIARKDSGLRNEDEIKAQASRWTLAIGNPNSTSGYVVPNHYLFARLGLDPRDDFKRVVTGSHEENWISVVEGRADLATTASVVFRRLCEQRPADCARLTIVWSSPLIPNDPLVWRKTLPETMKAKVAAFFNAYGRPAPNKSMQVLAQEKAVLRGVDTLAFQPSDNTQLRSIRDIQTGGRNRVERTPDPPTFEAKFISEPKDAEEGTRR